jgi:hypothetical protein
VNPSVLRQVQSRRESLRTLGRMGLMGSLGLLAYALVRRRAAANAGGYQTCMQNGVCRGCSALGNCGVPQALALKAATRRTTADDLENRRP